MLSLISRWVGCVATLGLVACGADFDTVQATADAEGSRGETGDDGPGPGVDPDADTGEDETGSGDDDPSSDEARGCQELDCGPGWCDDDAEVPVCECPEGHASVGYGCVPCEAMADTANLDLPLIVVTGRILLNGSVPPVSQYEHGDLFLRNPATGDEVFLGNTRAGEYTATVLPGTYDIIFVKRSGSSLVPDNLAGFVTRQLIDNHEPIDIELRTTAVAGSILFDDQTPPASQYENGRVFLHNVSTGDEVPLAQTRDATFAANVLPGTYSLRYEALAASTIAPHNPEAILRVIEVPEPSEIVHEIDASIPIATVHGSITLAGAAPPDSQYENGRIIFVDRTTGAQMEVAQTRKGEYSIPLVHGTYDIVYERIAGSTIVPRNERALLVEQIAIESSQTIDLDISVASLTGSVTIDGQLPPTSTSDDGVIRLYDSSTGDVVVLGHTRHGSFSRLVVPGTYEVRYAQATAGAIMPANLNARLEDVVVAAGDGDVVIDIPVAAVSGAITVGGAPPPTSEYSDGRIYLRNAESDDSVLLGNTRLASFDARVVPGVYDVVYVVETTGDGVPLNGAAHLLTVDVRQTPSFDIDVPLVRLHGTITVDGKSPPDTAENHGVLFVQDVLSNDRVALGDTRAGTYATRITAGRYLVGYRMSESSGLVPQNNDALLECIDLIAR
jgi:hypothetical protein